MASTTFLPGAATAPSPVTVEVMSESLCVDCKRFFQQSLITSYRKLGSSVVDLHIIAFGNSRIDFEKKVVSCQHGEAECDANVWQECAVENYGADSYIDFFDCLEDTLPMGHRDEPFDEFVFQKCTTTDNDSPTGLIPTTGSTVFK